MTGLVEVFSAWFRTFGYSVRLDATVQGASGSHHQLPLLVELDARRIGVYAWMRADTPNPAFFDAVRSATRDLRLDQSVILSLASLPDAERATLARSDVHVWDARRIAQELGEAVLAETCPDVWPRNDPLQTTRSKVMEEVLQAKEPVAPTPVETPAAEPLAELPFPVAAAPVLATPHQQPSRELVVPAAFAMFETPAPATPAPVHVAPVATAPATPSRPIRPILRTQVSKALAISLVKKKLRAIDRVFLRLSPYHVFDFEAHLLIDGSLDAETKRGRMAVDATLKKVMEWSLPLDIAELNAEGCDVDEKKVRVDTTGAENALRHELVNLVTRDVVLAEDGDEWSVVVKKKVALAPTDITLRSLGTFWIPIWRVSGKDGSIEIDATSGNVLHEEIAVEKSDSQLI